MTLDLVWIAVGLLLLAAGAEALVRGATGTALRLGVTTLAIGLTVVAFGTGSPELMVSIRGAMQGESDLVLGNVVGSNISNVALVLGLAALVRPMVVRSELIRREAPLMIAVTMLTWILMADGRLTRIDGTLLVTGAFGYTVASYVFAKRDRSRAVAAEFDEALMEPRRPVAVDWLLMAGGMGTLLLGAEALVSGATSLALRLGMSDVAIGLTVVAIGTSLPELATSVASSIKGEADVAFGNVLGSNVLNLLAVLGTAALIRPFDVAGLRPADVVVFVGSAVVLLPLLWRGSVLARWEGALLLTGYAVYLYSVL